MKFIYPAFLFVVVCLVSCGSGDENKKETEKTDSVKTEKPKPTFDTQKLVGQYMGEFGKSTIIISINYISGKNTSGYNIVRGNRRNIKGTLEAKDNLYHFKMDEPGNDEYDGKFVFTIDTVLFELIGSWKPYKEDEKITPKTYILKPLEKTVDSTHSFLGDWFGYKNDTEGTLTLKEDGSFIYKGYYYGEKEGLENEFNIKGSWIRDDKKVTLEFDRNPYMTAAKMVCTYVETDYGFSLRFQEEDVFNKYSHNEEYGY